MISIGYCPHNENTELLEGGGALLPTQQFFTMSKGSSETYRPFLIVQWVEPTLFFIFYGKLPYKNHESFGGKYFVKQNDRG